MKKFISLFFAVCLVLPLSSQNRSGVDIPNLAGFVTLKCDFHIHTIFSDGTLALYYLPHYKIIKVVLRNCCFFSFFNKKTLPLSNKK